jgi:hypothetical protein
MNIASIGHRSRQDHLSPCCIGRAQQDSAAQKILTLAIAGLHRQSARVVNRCGRPWNHRSPQLADAERGVSRFGSPVPGHGGRGSVELES